MAKNICNCSIDSDEDMKYHLPEMKKLSKLSDNKIILILGELEATDPVRTCNWYNLLLELCKIKVIEHIA
jgi:hypothetical protein